MKRITLLFAFIAISMAVWAQPVLNKPTYTFGDTVFHYSASYKIASNSYPATGLQTWDFSTYGTDPNDIYYVYTNPTTTPHSADFPTADICMVFTIPALSMVMDYVYFKITADSSWVLGERYPLSPSDDYDAIDPDAFKFPYSYGNENIDYSSGTDGSTDSSKKKYVAYGSIKTPYGSYPNVIMVEDYKMNSGVWTLESHVWYDVSTFFTVAEIDVQDSSVQWTKSKASTSEIQENLKQQYKVVLYPNPTQNQIQLNYNLNITTDVSAEIFGLNGQKQIVIMNQKQNPGTHQMPINLQQLPNGIYFARIKFGDQVYVEKIEVKH